MSRDSDIEVVPTCRREGISLVPYSPLKGYSTNYSTNMPLPFLVSLVLLVNQFSRHSGLEAVQCSLSVEPVSESIQLLNQFICPSFILPIKQSIGHSFSVCAVN